MTDQPNLFRTASGAVVELLMPPKDGMAFVRYVECGAKRWINSSAIRKAYGRRTDAPAP
jgi:hypothetical protein